MMQALGSVLARTRGFFARDSFEEQSFDRDKVLGFLANERDRSVLTSAGTRNRWDVTLAPTFEQAHQLLETLRVPVVLCDRDLLGQDWGTSVEELAACSHRACILLVSKVADEYLWNEIVRRGGYDVLSKPLQEDEVVRAIKLARSYWSSTSLTKR